MGGAKKNPGTKKVAAIERQSRRRRKRDGEPEGFLRWAGRFEASDSGLGSVTESNLNEGLRVPWRL